MIKLQFDPKVKEFRKYKYYPFAVEKAKQFN